MAITENNKTANLVDVLDELRFYADENRYDYDPLKDVFTVDERLSELCCRAADMVERDYVSREAYEDLRDEFVWETTFLHRMGKKCGTKDVPSLVAYVDKLEAEVDKLRIKSAKRAAAVERLRNCFYTSDSDLMRAMLNWGHEPHTGDDSRFVLIDLLTDDDAHSKAHSKTEPNLSEQSDSLSDDCVRSEPEMSEVGANLGSEPSTLEDFEGKGSEVDSREKLEADVHAIANNMYWESMVIAWLDRQAAITEREREQHWLEIIGASANCNFELTNRIAELQAKVDSLKRKLEASTDANTDYRDEWHRVCAERADLARELGECMAERDRYREEVSEMLAIAQQMQRLAAKHDE